MSRILLVSTVLILVIVVLRAVLGKWMSQRLRYALWLLVAIRLLLPFQLGHCAMSIENLFQPNIPTQPSVQIVVEPSQVSGEDIPSLQQEVPHSPNPLHLLWYVGMAVSGLWFATVNVRFYLRARKGAKRLSFEGVPLRVYVSDGVDTPCQIGRSIFLTPQVAEDKDKCKHVLAHELTHYYHGDTLWSLLRTILLCVYWFFPPVWLAAALSKKDCELACDEGALLRLGENERFAYGRTLLSVAEQNIKGRQLFGAEASIAQSKKELTARIKAIAKKKKCPVAVLLLLAMLVSLTAVCTFTGSALESPAEPPAEVVVSIPEATEPSTTQQQLTKPWSQTDPTKPQTEPLTAPPETETSPSVAQPESTHAEPEDRPSSTKRTTGAKFLGTYTLKVGEELSMPIYLEEYTRVSVNNPALARASFNYHPPFQRQNYRFTATVYKAGTVEIYFSTPKENYLAFIIYVVENNGRDEIGFAEKEEETPSFVLPEFNIP